MVLTNTYVLTICKIEPVALTVNFYFQNLQVLISYSYLKLSMTQIKLIISFLKPANPYIPYVSHTCYSVS